MTRILIVDDSVAIREGLYSLLDPQPDFEVVGSAEDRQEGLDKALELLPDVVIMDAQMPNMDGVEATRRIKEASPHIGVLFLSVFTDYTEMGMAAGANGYLVKDCEPQEVFSEVRRIAAEYRQQKDEARQAVRIPQVQATTTFGSTMLEGSTMTTAEQDVRNTTEEAFSILVERYAEQAYRVAFRILHNVHDAEDAVQEAFLSAYRAMPNFKGQSKVSTWLHRIVVNASLLKIRKERTRAQYLQLTGYEDAFVADWRANPEKAALDGELGEVLEEGLRRLSPHFRTAIVLRDVQGLTNEEAADALEITVSAFKSKLHRGRVLLRKYLEGYVAKPGENHGVLWVNAIIGNS